MAQLPANTRLAHQIRRASMLADLMARFEEAGRIWNAQFVENEEKSGDSAEWDAYVDAAGAIIAYRCTNLQEVRLRARFMLAEDFLIDILANSATSSPVEDFLRSMAEPVEERP